MNNVLAAFIMLTRLPFWKIKEVPAECFKHVVDWRTFSTALVAAPPENGLLPS